MVERFAALVSRPPHDVPLDETALLIAARARGPEAVDDRAAMARLDELAARCELPTFDGLRRFLFEREGFTGNAVDYQHPDNSYLDRVLERRLGIPITLSVVMIEVGRRLGVGVVPIGMPAHFLVRAGDPEIYCDPFGGGRLLDRQGCAALFAAATGGAQPFDRSFLAPVRPTQVLARMLNNLEHGPFATDPVRLGELLDLHVVLPDLGPGERVALASRLAQVGRFSEAAAVVDGGAEALADAAPLRQQARALRARLN